MGVGYEVLRGTLNWWFTSVQVGGLFKYAFNNIRMEASLDYDKPNRPSNLPVTVKMYTGENHTTKKFYSPNEKVKKNA